MVGIGDVVLVEVELVTVASVVSGDIVVVD